MMYVFTYDILATNFKTWERVTIKSSLGTQCFADSGALVHQSWPILPQHIACNKSPADQGWKVYPLRTKDSMKSRMESPIPWTQETFLWPLPCASAKAALGPSASSLTLGDYTTGLMNQISEWIHQGAYESNQGFSMVLGRRVQSVTFEDTVAGIITLMEHWNPAFAPSSSHEIILSI